MRPLHCDKRFMSECDSDWIFQIKKQEIWHTIHRTNPSGHIAIAPDYDVYFKKQYHETHQDELLKP